VKDILFSEFDNVDFLGLGFNFDSSSSSSLPGTPSRNDQSIIKSK
jgi:hypothetical protein